jgi:hypothetical protein
MLNCFILIAGSLLALISAPVTAEPARMPRPDPPDRRL